MQLTLHNIQDLYLDKYIECLEKEILKFDSDSLVLNYNLYNPGQLSQYQVYWKKNSDQVRVRYFSKNKKSNNLEYNLLDQTSRSFKRIKLDLLIMTLYVCLIKQNFDHDFDVERKISTKSISKFVNESLKKRFEAYHGALSHYLKDKHGLTPKLLYKKKSLFSSRSIRELLDIIEDIQRCSDLDDTHQELKDYLEKITLRADHGEDVMNFQHFIYLNCSLNNFKLSISGQDFQAMCHLKAASFESWKQHTKSNLGALAWLKNSINEKSQIDLTKPVMIQFMTNSRFCVNDDCRLRLDHDIDMNTTSVIQLKSETDFDSKVIRLYAESHKVELKHLSSIKSYFDDISKVYRYLYDLSYTPDLT